MATSFDSETTAAFGEEPIFGLRHRLTRFAWAICWTLLASWTQPLHGWRRFLLRAFGAKVGKGVYIAPSARIWFPGNLVLDDYAAIADNTDVYCMATITVGKYAVISKRAHVCTGTHDVDDPQFPLITAPITIEDYAWVAADAFVGPGVTVGKGAVLGTHGVTVRNLRPWTIYAGNPVREIRARRPFERSDEPFRGWREPKREIDNPA